MKVFSNVKPFAALLIAAMFVSGAMAAESKCGGEMNASKDTKEMKKSADAKCGTSKCGGEKASEAKKPADAKCGAAKCGGEKK